MCFTVFLWYKPGVHFTETDCSIYSAEFKIPTGLLKCECHEGVHVPSSAVQPSSSLFSG